MSDGEYSEWTSRDTGLSRQSDEFRHGVHRCAVLAHEGDLAGFQACVGAAYSGFDRNYQAALGETRIMYPNTAQGCLADLKRYHAALADYGTDVRAIVLAARNLDMHRVIALARATTPVIELYRFDDGLVRTRCKPL